MTEEHVEKLEEIQEFALHKACYIKSEIEKHWDKMSQCMLSQALDDMKDCIKIVKDSETAIVMARDPKKLDPTMVK